MERVIKTKKDGAKAIPYLLPALISIFALTFLPIVYTIYISLTDFTMYTQSNYHFVGIQNFIDVLTGPFKQVFLPVFGWTFSFALISTAGCFFVGLIIALVLSNKHMKEAFVYKSFLVIPWALPVTVAILSWQGLLNTDYGAINRVLINLHILSAPVQWLTNPWWARVAVIIVNIWLGFPYMMNICIGTISAISEDQYEAAEVDGASKFTQFVKITLPELARTAYPLLISSFAFNFNNFGSAFLLTEGLPARLDTQFAGYTDILSSTTYKLATQFGRYDIGSALSIIIFIIIAIISGTQMKMSGQFKEVD
ncbi:sugar ABC transporter permease [Clostridium sp. C8-1-8]|uniref:carbohydrate ABC transporter permease n=1 Tax=Clostridium sp. C8-1-8 TaxID=2698831 RepID=UPI001FAD6F23|nr:sugar ABC transporter permease [Clostridium sp. C8-1-8]